MRILLLVLAVAGVIAVLALRAWWTGRTTHRSPQVMQAEAEPTPPPVPDEDHAPPGSRPDRERHGKP